MPDLLKRPAFWVLAFAVGIRLVFLTQLQANPYFDLELAVYDQHNFHEGAKALAAGDWRAPSPSELYSPLYKYLLGAVYAAAAPFTDLRIGAARTLQLALGVAVTWWIFRLGAFWGSPRAGALAAVLYSALGQALFMEAKLLREFPATAAMMAALWVGRRGWTHRPGWIASALLLALAVQLRANLELLALLFLWRPIRERRWAAAALWIAVFMTALLPSKLRNAVVLGGPDAAFPNGGDRMFVIEPQGSAVLAVTNHPCQDEPYCKHQAVSHVKALEDYGYGAPVKPSMGLTCRMVARWALDDPAGFVQLQMRKLYWTLWDGEVASNHNVYLWQELAPALALPGSHVGLYVALLLGAAAWAPARRAVPGVVWAALGLVLAGVLVAFPAGRVRAPAYPLFMLATAFAARGAWQAARQGPPGDLLRPAAVTFLAAVLLWPPEPAWLHRTLGMAKAPLTRDALHKPNDMGNLAVAFMERGRPGDEAEAEYWITRAWNRSIGGQTLYLPHSARAAEHVYGRTGLARLRRGEGASVPALAARWERMLPRSPHPHAVASQVDLLTGAPSPTCLKAVYRACLRAQDPAIYMGLVALYEARLGETARARDALARTRSSPLPASRQAELEALLALPPPPVRLQDPELDDLRQLHDNPKDPAAHARLIARYRAEGLPWRAAFHENLLGKAVGMDRAVPYPPGR